MTKQRLDKVMLERGLVSSREQAQSAIIAGKVLVNGMLRDKPGSRVSLQDVIRLTGETMPYVSRGGLKLEAALNLFDFNVKELVCLDVGASTGGFTDCLLQNGAQKVFAVDVGYGQLAWKLRHDPRVIVIERTNVRHISDDMIHEPIDLAVIDVSFISLKIVIPAVMPFLKPTAAVIALIKPQFEVGKGKVGKGGVVRDPSLHQAVTQDMNKFFRSVFNKVLAPIPSPLLGPKGNKEFLALISLPINKP